MLTWVLIIIIALCLATAGWIIARRLPALRLLDVENLPQEKERRKKDELISRRLEDEGKKIGEFWRRTFLPAVKGWRQLQLRFRIYVGKVERLWRHEQQIKKQEQTDPEKAPVADAEKSRAFLADAEKSFGAGDYARAEEQFIAAIKHDTKNAAAYRGLADTYFTQNSLEEARETYRFVLKLEPDDDTVLVKLAEIAESQGDLEEAIEHLQAAALLNDSFASRFYKLGELLLKVGQPATAKEAAAQALELEPNNPKYLDLMVEIAIILRERPEAEKYYQALRLINPDNNKLPAWQEKIKAL